MCQTVKIKDLSAGDQIYWFKNDTHTLDWNSWDETEAEDWTDISKYKDAIKGWTVYGVIRKGLFHYVSNN